MTPVAEPHTGAEERYNSAHAKTRCIVERSFGILKARFRCLLNKERSLFFHLNDVTIIIACSVLHNLATRYVLQDPEIEVDFYNNKSKEVEAQQLYILPEENGRVASTELINDRFAFNLFEIN